MATIALLIGGAILNATTFVGGSYLAKYLSGKNPEIERKRHDKALEKYQKDWATYQEKREKFQDWEVEQDRIRERAERDISSTTHSLDLYAKTHPKPPVEPEWNNYYKPSNDQKQGELLYVGGGMLALAYGASKFL